MNLKKISPRLFVSEQINPADAGRIAAQGIKTIICNRPHCETPDQPDTETLAAAAADVGIEFLHIPVVAGSITDADVAEFAKAYKNAKEPILAYCRTGMRSTTLWALTEAESLDVNTILSTAEDVGYDLTGLRPRLEACTLSTAEVTLR